MKLQVDKSHYISDIYFNKNRFLSYFYQFDTINKLKAKKILEIGIGANIIKKLISDNVDYFTLDLDNNLKPDICGDILHLPIKDDIFDLIVAFEVFEHMPYNKFIDILYSLHNITKKFFLFSVPDFTRMYWLNFYLPFLRIREYAAEIPKKDPPKLEFNGEHYWEIGKNNITKNIIINDVIKTGFTLVKTFRPADLYCHRYFLFSK